MSLCPWFSLRSFLSSSGIDVSDWHLLLTLVLALAFLPVLAFFLASVGLSWFRGLFCSFPCGGSGLSFFLWLAEAHITFQPRNIIVFTFIFNFCPSELDYYAASASMTSPEVQFACVLKNNNNNFTFYLWAPSKALETTYSKKPKSTCLKQTVKISKREKKMYII